MISHFEINVNLFAELFNMRKRKLYVSELASFCNKVVCFLRFIGKLMIESICGKMKEKGQKASFRKGEEVYLFGNIFGSAVGII
jgi:hypothetical protein